MFRGFIHFIHSVCLDVGCISISKARSQESLLTDKGRIGLESKCKFMKEYKGKRFCPVHNADGLPCGSQPVGLREHRDLLEVDGVGNEVVFQLSENAKSRARDDACSF